MFRVATIALLVFTTIVMTDAVLIRPHAEAAMLELNRSHVGEKAARNKFSKRWRSYITYSTGEKIDDGVIDISDIDSAGPDKVKVTHSRYDGSYIAYTLSYPDRIEVQIPLGDGRVAHYNGVLVSSDRIQGQFFITEGNQSQQGVSVNKKISVGHKTPLVEVGTWEAGTG